MACSSSPSTSASPARSPAPSTRSPTATLDDADYAAAVRFGIDRDAEADWAGVLAARTSRATPSSAACRRTDREEVHRHLDSEFADAALWYREAPGCRDGLAALAGDRRAPRHRLERRRDDRRAPARRARSSRSGPGLGVEVECVIDSGAVGVMKPDPRIFRMALDAMDVDADDAWYVGDMPGIDVVGARRAGLRPFLVDPLGLHHEADYDRVDSLAELARPRRRRRERVWSAGAAGHDPPMHRHPTTSAWRARRAAADDDETLAALGRRLPRQPGQRQRGARRRARAGPALVARAACRYRSTS